MLRIVLFPFSFLFGFITCVRNKLYDWKCLSSTQYDDIYVISVGNITVGGTGKTPFVEYLLRSLSQRYQIATLSRGYKRATKGFRFVTAQTTPQQVGDEPYQIKQKFPDVVVAVDVDRRRGITNIRKDYPEIQIILLDDAFQYRKIKPNLSILLTDYSRPLYRDSMLPAGRLREWACFAKRADIMVVTKLPAEIKPEEQQNMKQYYAKIFPNDIFFSVIEYNEPLPVFSNNQKISTADLRKYEVLLITGIANPSPFEDYIRRFAASVQTISFPDHHAFTEKDMVYIAGKWNEKNTNHKLLVTTEKDAVRLQQMNIQETLKRNSYYAPICFRFSGMISSDATSFDFWISRKLDDFFAKE